MAPSIERLGYDPVPGEHLSDATLLRARMYSWACNLNEPTCINDASTKFAQWMESPEQIEL